VIVGLIWPGISSFQTQPRDTSQQVENKFIVPFEDNPYFLGRDQFLETLKAKLSDDTSRRYTHRVALHGMGGIGKSQCAIAYVYQNRGAYERVYWITAVDRSALLSGYRSIA
jgi:hypothetical protein